MTFNSLILILRKQVTQKWGRFLLASGGIMIGIWAITLTSTLSLGLSDTIIKALNSQTFAKEITISKTAKAQTSYFEVTEAPVFVPLSDTEIVNLKNKFPDIVDISPEARMNIYIHTSVSNLSTKCVELETQSNKEILQNLSVGSNQNPQNFPQLDELSKKCISQNVESKGFQNFYETNRTNWIGKTSQLEKNEIAICFKCGGDSLNEKLGVKEPSELLGKELTMELQRAPEFFEAGKSVDVSNLNRPKTQINKSELIKLKVAAVIDDREGNLFGPLPIYVDYSYFKQAFKLANPDLDANKYAPLQNTVFINSYDNLDKTIKNLVNEKLLTFSLAQTIISSITTAFLVLTFVLAAFGFIALIASVFGIINVMTISVLERKKEIGVLKALGARDGDIFKIFLFEGVILGFLGWLLGTMLAFLMGIGISLVFKIVLDNNKELKENLLTLNITGFTPSFPWWLLLGTFVLAIFFTSLSGVFPALRASKQNPVDVLRSE
jgi:ABC-type antimicrobial peptide transport system permease subunit